MVKYDGIIRTFLVVSCYSRVRFNKPMSSASLACWCAGYEMGSNTVGEAIETGFGLQPNIRKNGETPVEE